MLIMMSIVMNPFIVDDLLFYLCSLVALVYLTPSKKIIRMKIT